MRFQTELVPARLIRRYKRFLADCVLEDSGTEVTAHCANPGSMLGLAEPGTRIWVEPNDDPKKKLKAALTAGEIPQLSAYREVRAEVKYGQNSRIDFLLSAPGLTDLYVEVKSVTLSRRAGLAEFPDSVTARGAKHLAELASMVGQGHRAMMLYLIQRTDCTGFALAGDIDPTYAAAYAEATERGVETLCLSTNISPEKVTVSEPLEIRM